MSKHKALELASRLDAAATVSDMGRQKDPSDHRRQAAAELRALHALIVQMREALGSNVNGCSLAIDAPKMAREALAAADQYLGEQA